MTVDELRQDLSERIGRPVELLLSREGDAVIELTDLYKPLPPVLVGDCVCVMERR